MTVKLPKPYITVPWLGKTNEPGTWVQLSVFNNELVSKECTDPRVPFGILIDAVYINNRLMARIDATIGGVWETDVIDYSQRYPINATLFVKNGKLTTQDPSDGYDSGQDGYDGYEGGSYTVSFAVGVGMVVRPPLTDNPTLEFLRF